MKTKTYGKFTRDFDYYTVDEAGYFDGECLGGEEILRTENLADATLAFSRSLSDFTAGQYDTVREEYDWGISYVFTDGNASITVNLIGRRD